jgi:hypothetical protein
VKGTPEGLIVKAAAGSDEAGTGIFPGTSVIKLAVDTYEGAVSIPMLVEVTTHSDRTIKRTCFRRSNNGRIRGFAGELWSKSGRGTNATDALTCSPLDGSCGLCCGFLVRRPL